MRTLAVSLLAAVIALGSGRDGQTAAAPVPKHLMKEAVDDKVRLQGRWKLAVLGSGELASPFGEAPNLVVVVRGNTMTSTLDNQVTTCEFKLDTADGLRRLSTANSRTTVDGKPVDDLEEWAVGYAIEGDKWIVASDLSSKKPRDPKKPEADTIMMVFTRVQDKN